MGVWLSWLEHLPCKQGVDGSNPSISTSSGHRVVAHTTSCGHFFKNFFSVKFGVNFGVKFDYFFLTAFLIMLVIISIAIKMAKVIAIQINSFS